jgi:hypothetical protein
MSGLNVVSGRVVIILVECRKVANELGANFKLGLVQQIRAQRSRFDQVTGIAKNDIRLFHHELACKLIAIATGSFGKKLKDIPGETLFDGALKLNVGPFKRARRVIAKQILGKPCQAIVGNGEHPFEMPRQILMCANGIRLHGLIFLSVALCPYNIIGRVSVKRFL